MLKELSLTNFKSWKSIPTMEFGSITGLFGTNSSGKSSILQFLLMLKQTVESPDRSLPLHIGDDKTYVNLGSAKEMLHGNSVDEKLTFSMQWELPQPLEIMDPEDLSHSRAIHKASSMNFDCSLALNTKSQLVVQHFSYSADGFTATVTKKKGKYHLEPQASEAFKFKRIPGRAWDLPAPGKFYSFPDQINYYFKNAALLSAFELELTKLLRDRIHYLGPLRDYPKRQYIWTGGQPMDMGPRGERFVDAILTARDKQVMIDPGYKKRKILLEIYIAEWLKRLDLIHSFRVEPIVKGGNIYQVKVKKNPNSTEVLITDVGFGVSQILPVITLCYYVPEGSIILLEQPEIHLHPSVQAGLADVFIDAVKTRNVQIIVESHSEHLLRRLQLRIAEEKINSNQVKLYFCKMEDKASELEPLQLNLFGEIENWPDRFFGDEFGELAATNEAIIRRMETVEA